jgi:hypothetical protein
MPAKIIAAARWETAKRFKFPDVTGVLLFLNIVVRIHRCGNQQRLFVTAKDLDVIPAESDPAGLSQMRP